MTYATRQLNMLPLPHVIMPTMMCCSTITGIPHIPLPSDTMAEQLPLADPFFATEEESNIVNNINNWVFSIPMDQPPPPLVAQEEARPHQETDQLVCSTPHRPRWRMEDGEMVCVALAPSPLTTPHCTTQHMLPLTLVRERRRAFLVATPTLPLQATTHQGGHPDLLVCPPLPRVGGASDTPEHSNDVENNLGATDVQEHTTHHYVPLLLPLETANVCVLIAPNINCSHPCEDAEVECAHNGDDQLEEGGSECNTITENPTPPTQQFVSGLIESHDVT